ncbi:MAG: MFS transporter [Bacillota bacterium]
MLKSRIAIMQFFQFFVWGSWMPTIAAWWFGTQHWSGAQFGAIFSTMGIASLFAPTIAGIIADRWINAERLYGVLMIINGVLLYMATTAANPGEMFVYMLAGMFFYMPTIGLSITISYATMEKAGMNIIKEYPPIRVLGTVGFIVATWIVSLTKNETSIYMFHQAAIAAIALGLFGFTMPKVPPLGKSKGGSMTEVLGLQAFKMLKDGKMFMFFFFSMLLGGALQLTNAYGDLFLHSFDGVAQYSTTIAVKYPAIIQSISQMSETFMILLIPFVLRRFGIKKVMLMSMFAWVFRFGLYSFADPGPGLWMIILSCIIYGAAFDFFNISGSLYVETQADPSIRASAQGLFMFMTNGIGAVLGSTISGWMIGAYFTTKVGDAEVIHWQGFDGVWMVFAIYALIVGVLFAIMFKHKHNPKELENFHH